MKYTLKKLMYEKYGEDRFAVACEIVARWVQFDTKNKNFSKELIEKVCNANDTDEIELSLQEEESLRRLFALNTTDQLYN